MLSVRTSLMRISRTNNALALRVLSTKPAPVAPAKPPTAAPAAGAGEEGALSPVTEKRQEMSKFSRHMVWGKAGEYMPAPVLPEDPKEIAALDNADQPFHTHMDGTKRTVIIRQLKKKTRQEPISMESTWQIFFYEDGMTSEKWDNSLMGWTSNADPYQSAPPLKFRNAAEAVYFAKKRGWNYLVKHPITRYMRDDDCQYQDNFLPQAVADLVAREGTSCKWWQRESSCTSHYMRPLNYHGTGIVGQYGPNGDAPIEPHVEGCYKSR
jgi:hypothetical protein